LARQIPGFSGADIANLVNEAAIRTTKQDRDRITHKDIEESIERIALGHGRTEIRYSKDEKLMIAFHEAGHALLELHFIKYNDFHKVSILGRGQISGYTVSFPKREHSFASQEQLMAELICLFGGRVAEWRKFKSRSTGAADDLQKASMLAYIMITKFGMNDVIGPVSIAGLASQTADYDVAQQGNILGLYIFDEVKKILQIAETEAEKLIDQYSLHLEAVANEMLERETLYKADIDNIVASISYKNT